MAEPIRARTKTESDSLDIDAGEESSALYEAVLRSRPLARSNEEAARIAETRLQQLAMDQGLSVDALIEQAHTTHNSQPFHIEALQLERQLGFLRR